jgi:hypothetical protein
VNIAAAPAIPVFVGAGSPPRTVAGTGASHRAARSHANIRGEDAAPTKATPTRKPSRAPITPNMKIADVQHKVYTRDLFGND